MKGSVKIAYWDTAQGNPPRSIVGDIKGTPTIKFILPSKKNARTSNKKKSVSDYNGERKADGMVEYARSMQPSYAIYINGEAALTKFIAQADKYALPKVLVISKDVATSPVTKAISTEFRRRALVGNMIASKPNAAALERLGLGDWLADKSGERTVIGFMRGEGDFPMMKKKGAFPKYTVKSASVFLSKVALDKPYFEHEAFLSKAEGGGEEEGGSEKKKKKEAAADSKESTKKDGKEEL